MGSVNAAFYQHPRDKQALSALESIPVFPAFMKAVMKVLDERFVYIQTASSMIQLSNRQLPEIYDKLPPICEKLGIPVPHLFLKGSREVNAATTNESDPIIILNAGTLEACSDDVVTAILAHECGHIACHHVLYRNVGDLLLSGAISLIPGIGPLISMGLEYAFYSWIQCSEYSADRAAAVALGGSKPVVDTMASLSGDFKMLGLDVRKEVFLEQAAIYEQTINESTTNRIFELLANRNEDHPFNAYRALQIARWCETPEFFYTQDIINDCAQPVDPYTGLPMGGPPSVGAPLPMGVTAPGGGPVAMGAHGPMGCTAQAASVSQPSAAGASAELQVETVVIREELRQADQRVQIVQEGNQFCLNCGHPIVSGHMFCAGCGAKLQ